MKSTKGLKSKKGGASTGSMHTKGQLRKGIVESPDMRHAEKRKEFTREMNKSNKRTSVRRKK